MARCGRTAARCVGLAGGSPVTRPDSHAWKRAKAAGDANNDWVVTQRLLADRQVDAPLAEVTQRFEELYQGHGQRAGLRERERPLLSRDELERLAGRWGELEGDGALAVDVTDLVGAADALEIGDRAEVDDRAAGSGDGQSEEFVEWLLAFFAFGEDLDVFEFTVLLVVTEEEDAVAAGLDGGAEVGAGHFEFAQAFVVGDDAEFIEREGEVRRGGSDV